MRDTVPNDGGNSYPANSRITANRKLENTSGLPPLYTSRRLSSSSVIVTLAFRLMEIIAAL